MIYFQDTLPNRNTMCGLCQNDIYRLYSVYNVFQCRINIADIKLTMWTNFARLVPIRFFIAIYILCMFIDYCILYISIFVLPLGVIISIIIIIIPKMMFIMLSSWPQGHCESSLGSFDECRTAPSGRRPSDQATCLGLWVRL